jgi:hypothetical protein
MSFRAQIQAQRNLPRCPRYRIASAPLRSQKDPEPRAVGHGIDSHRRCRWINFLCRRRDESEQRHNHKPSRFRRRPRSGSGTAPAKNYSERRINQNSPHNFGLLWASVATRFARDGCPERRKSWVTFCLHQDAPLPPWSAPFDPKVPLRTSMLEWAAPATGR